MAYTFENSVDGNQQKQLVQLNPEVTLKGDMGTLGWGVSPFSFSATPYPPYSFFLLIFEHPRDMGMDYWSTSQSLGISSTPERLL